jgi:hypothetical protein
VIDEYPADAIGQVHLWLEDLASDRLSRCALFPAAGSLKKLEEEVALGRTDYRDLIVAADYDRFLIQLRDFNRPFGEEAVPNPLEFQMRRSQPNKRSGPTT